ncbi:hypothetical protein DPSP01_005574 [Paraphaeosphaeria sporulosa]
MRCCGPFGLLTPLAAYFLYCPLSSSSLKCSCFILSTGGQRRNGDNFDYDFGYDCKYEYIDHFYRSSDRYNHFSLYSCCISNHNNNNEYNHNDFASSDGYVGLYRGCISYYSEHHVYQHHNEHNNKYGDIASSDRYIGIYGCRFFSIHQYNLDHHNDHDIYSDTASRHYYFSIHNRSVYGSNQHYIYYHDHFAGGDNHNHLHDYFYFACGDHHVGLHCGRIRNNLDNHFNLF